MTDSAEWLDLHLLCQRLNVSERTAHRWIRSGKVAVATIGGRRLYRPRVTGLDGQVPPLPDSAASRRHMAAAVGGATAESDDVSGRDSGGAGVGGVGTSIETARVLALVERYEARIDVLLAERRELAGQVGTVAAHAEILAVEVERQRAAVQGAEAAAQLAAVEARHLAEQAAAERARVEAEARRVLELERRDRHGAEVERDRARAEVRELRAAVEAARAAAAEQLRALPWWRFGERRQLRALLTAPA